MDTPSPENPLQITGNTPMGEAARLFIQTQFERMQEHESIAREGSNSLGVHQMRVAIRQIRSVYDVAGDYLPKSYRPYKKLLRRTARRLGTVRDLDVLLIALADDPPPDDKLYKVIDRRRERMRARLLVWLDDPRYLDFQADFVMELSTPLPPPPLEDTQPVPFEVAHIAPPLIYSQMATVRSYEPLLAHASELPAETLHALRIQFKKLRYTLEFFKDPLGDSIKPVIKAIKAQQDSLGLFNDHSVAIELMHTLIAQDTRNNAEAKACKAYMRQRRALLGPSVEHFMTHWQEFNTPEMRQALGQAVASL